MWIELHDTNGEKVWINFDNTTKMGLGLGREGTWIKFIGEKPSRNTRRDN